MKSGWSLRWRVTWGLIAFQVVTPIIITMLIAYWAFQASPNGVLPDPGLSEAAAKSIGRNEQGELAVYPNEALAEKLIASPELWFVAQMESGDRVTFGPAPAIAQEMVDVSDRLKMLEIRGQDDDPALTSRLDRISTPMGKFTVLSGGGAFVSDAQALFVLTNFLLLLPMSISVMLTLICIPLFIRWCLRSIKTLSKELQKISFQSRGVKLSGAGVPVEFVPVVDRVNEALRRIDAGFEVTERFFVNAAHELRTPIAILQVRLDGLAPGPEREKLTQVVRRLATLVTQLLDIERFRQNSPEARLINLHDVVSEAVADIAPYAVSRGYTIELEASGEPVWVEGDAQALDRMIVNLLQNAVQHGGGHGAIVVGLGQDGKITVRDDGPGIPLESRDRIFEPFYRVNPHGSGAGLGLKMVRDIAVMHHGGVSLDASTARGAAFIITLPVKSRQAVQDGIRDGKFFRPQ